MAIVVGSVQVSVVPDARQFQARLRAELGNTPDVPVGVNLDTTEAERKLAELTRDRTLRIVADLDDGGARAKLDDLVRDRVARIKADLDDADAKLRLAELTRDRSTRVRVDVDSSGIAGAQAGMGGLLAAGLALGPALIPVGAAITGALAGIGATAVAGAAGIGVLALAFSGIGGALKAMGAAQAAAGVGASKSAASVVNADAQIASAEAGLVNARANAANSAVNAAESIRNAQRGLVDAQRSSSQQIQSSQRGLVDAQRSSSQQIQSALQGVTAARVGSSQAIQSAIAQELTAERSLTTAEQAEQQAQVALTAARVAARQSIQDLNNQVLDGALAQRQAVLDLESARTALGKTQTNPTATGQQRQQAQLTYDQAVQHLAELQLQNRRLADQKKASDKAGVAGSKQVQTAEQQLAATRQGVLDAQAKLVAAEKAVTQARLDGAARVAAAEQSLSNAQITGAENVLKAQQSLSNAQITGAENVLKAQQAVSDAYRAGAAQDRQSAYSVAQAQQAVAAAHRAAATAAGSSSAAVTKLNTAMAGLSPAGRQFVTFLYGLKSQLGVLRAAAQGGLFPGLETGIRALLPLLPEMARFVGSLAKTMGDLFAQAGKALGSPFWQRFFTYMSLTAGPIIMEFAQVVGNLAEGFAGLLIAFLPVTNQLGGGLVSLTKKFADFGASASTSSSFQHFLDYVKTSGPEVVSILGKIGTTFGHLIEALAPAGLVILHALGGLADVLNKLPLGILAAAYLGFAGLKTGALLLSKAVGVVSKAVGLFGIELGATPIGAAVIAVGILAAGMIYLYKHSQPVRDVFGEVGKAFSEMYTRLQPVVQGILRQVFLGLHQAVDTISASIQRNRPEVDAMVAAFKRLGDFIITKVLPVLGPILKAVLIGLGDNIAAAIDDVGAIERAFVSIPGVATRAWRAVRSAFITGINDVLKVVNFFIRALDKIPGVNIGQVGLVSVISNQSGGNTGTGGGRGLASGGTVPPFVTNGPRAIVGEGDPRFPEFVIPTDPKFRQRALDLYRALGMQMLAEGGVIGSVWGGLKDAASFGRDALSHGAGWAVNAAESVTGRVIDQLIPAGVFRDLAVGVVHKIGDAITSVVGSAVAAPAINVSSVVPASRAGAVSLGQRMASQVGWGTGAEWASMFAQLQYESGWDNTAQNPTSTAFGIGQFLDTTWADVGLSKTSDPATQLLGYLRYVRQRYGDPIASWEFEKRHNFYAQGGLIRGVGGPVDDANMIHASNGEYMVRAAAVARPGVLPMLEAVNAGAPVGQRPVNMTFVAQQTDQQGVYAALRAADLLYGVRI